MSSTARASARKMSPKISFCCSASPPWVIRIPGGRETPAICRIASVITSPVERPETFHSTFTTRSRFRWLITAGPTPSVMAATWPSGTVTGSPAGPATTSGSWLRSAARRRASGTRRTITSRVSPAGSTQSPASMPANAGRSDCATCPTLIPIAEARPRSSVTVSSGFWPLVEIERSTTFGTVATRSRSCSATRLSAAGSSPRISNCNCFRPPPKSLVKTASVTPLIAAIRSRSSAATSSALRGREFLGVRRTYIWPMSTAPEIPPPSVV